MASSVYPVNPVDAVEYTRSEVFEKRLLFHSEPYVILIVTVLFKAI